MIRTLIAAIGIMLIASTAASADIIFENKTDRVLDIYVTDGTNMARSFTIGTSEKVTIPASREGKIDIKYAGAKHNTKVIETVRHSGNDRYRVTLDKEGKLQVKRIRMHW